MPSISFAAITIAYEIVNNTAFPQDLPYDKAAFKLQGDGHLTLMLACNTPDVIKAYQYQNTQPAIDLVNQIALRPYRIRSRGYDGKQWYLKVSSTGDFAKSGQIYSGFKLEFGEAPHKPESTGRVYTKGPESSYYPSVLGLKWEKPE